MSRTPIIRFATAAVAIAGMTFAAGSAIADHHMEQEKSGTADKSTDKKTIVAVAQEAGDFTTLVKALKAAELVETLQGDGPFTVFAPTDEAFKALPSGALDNLLQPENKDKLKTVLLHHVVSGKVMAADVVKLDEAETVAGQSIDIKTEGDTVMLNGTIKVIKTDIPADNGVIHVIDGVLLPNIKEAGSSASDGMDREDRDARDNM